MPFNACVVQSILFYSKWRIHCYSYNMLRHVQSFKLYYIYAFCHYLVQCQVLNYDWPWHSNLSKGLQVVVGGKSHRAVPSVLPVDVFIVVYWCCVVSEVLSQYPTKFPTSKVVCYIAELPLRLLNSLKPTQHGRHFADDVSKFLEWKCLNSAKTVTEVCS